MSLDGRRSKSEQTHRLHTTGERAAKQLLERTAELSRHSTPEGILQQVKDKSNGIVLALDIDQCSAYGEDTNDILRIISSITNHFQDKNIRSDVFKITQYLINPAMLKAVSTIRANGRPVYILFYTKKHKIADYFHKGLLAPIKKILTEENIMMPEEYSTVFFSGGNLLDSWHYLYSQLTSKCPLVRWEARPYYQLELNRIAILTWTASIMLGLPYSAPVYITSGRKDLNTVARSLGDPSLFNKCLLFDDKSEAHAAALGQSLGDARMIPVQKFNLTSMNKLRAEDLLRQLQARFPIPADFVARNYTLYNEASKATSSWPIDRTVLSHGNWHLHTDLAGETEGDPWDLGYIFNDDTEMPELIEDEDEDEEHAAVEDNLRELGLYGRRSLTDPPSKH